MVDILEALSGIGIDINKCILCGICASGCPQGEIVDYRPHEIAYLLRLGMVDKAISSRAINICLTCFLCEDRCPWGIKLTRLYIYLNNIRVREFGLDKDSKLVLDMIREKGRLDEASLVRSVWGLSRVLRLALRNPRLARLGLGSIRAPGDISKIRRIFSVVGGYR